MGLSFGSLISNDCGIGSMVLGMGSASISLNSGTIGAESFCTIRVSLTVPGTAASGAYTNTTDVITATIDGSPTIGNMPSDDLYVDTSPIITKTFLDNPVNTGDTTELEFTITNVSATTTAMKTHSHTISDSCCNSKSLFAPELFLSLVQFYNLNKVGSLDHKLPAPV
ncbi:MAG: hypothetical protein ACI9J2_000708 [Saprospiraceae bacterium]|jgi:hypothetical protein